MSPSYLTIELKVASSFMYSWVAIIGSDSPTGGNWEGVLISSALAIFSEFFFFGSGNFLSRRLRAHAVAALLIEVTSFGKTSESFSSSEGSNPQIWDLSFLVELLNMPSICRMSLLHSRLLFYPHLSVFLLLAWRSLSLNFFDYRLSNQIKWSLRHLSSPWEYLHLNIAEKSLLLPDSSLLMCKVKYKRLFIADYAFLREL